MENKKTYKGFTKEELNNLKELSKLLKDKEIENLIDKKIDNDSKTNINKK